MCKYMIIEKKMQDKPIAIFIIHLSLSSNE